MRFHSASPDATWRHAKALADLLQSDDIVFLEGAMGAGKTLLTGGVIDALGGDASAVASPTYGLLHEYRTPRFPVRHLDLYRLADPAEVLGLQLDEMYGAGPILIEWPERARAFLGRPTIRVTVEIAGDQAREIAITRMHTPN